MEPWNVKLTVCFENPFWVGICERREDKRYQVCKIVFGAEPSDQEVYEFLLKNWTQLTFSPSIPSETCCERKLNPKRLQRIIHNELQQGVGTKAQQALKLQQEQKKQERRACSKQKREQDAQMRFALRQEKRKAKHKGH